MTPEHISYLNFALMLFLLLGQLGQWVGKRETTEAGMTDRVHRLEADAARKDVLAAELKAIHEKLTAIGDAQDEIQRRLTRVEVLVRNGSTQYPPPQG